jgi:hypothetical protein
MKRTFTRFYHRRDKAEDSMLELSTHEKQNVYLQEVYFGHMLKGVEYILRTESEMINLQCNFIAFVEYHMTKAERERFELENAVYSWYHFQLKARGTTFINTTTGQTYTALQLYSWQQGKKETLTSMLKDEYLTILQVPKLKKETDTQNESK